MAKSKSDFQRQCMLVSFLLWTPETRIRTRASAGQTHTLESVVQHAGSVQVYRAALAVSNTEERYQEQD